VRSRCWLRTAAATPGAHASAEVISRLHPPPFFPRRKVHLREKWGPAWGILQGRVQAMHGYLSEAGGDSIRHVPGLWRTVLLLPPCSDAWRWLAA
jgi:hypothetical protein